MSVAHERLEQASDCSFTEEGEIKLTINGHSLESIEEEISCEFGPDLVTGMSVKADIPL